MLASSSISSPRPLDHVRGSCSRGCPQRWWPSLHARSSLVQDQNRPAWRCLSVLNEMETGEHSKRLALTPLIQEDVSRLEVTVHDRPLLALMARVEGCYYLLQQPPDKALLYRRPGTTASFSLDAHAQQTSTQTHLDFLLDLINAAKSPPWQYSIMM